MKTTRTMGVKAVGFIDTDIILLKDPTPVMMEKMTKYKRINIFSQCDENGGINGNCSNNMNCPCLCSGVLVFRNIKDNYPLFLYKDQDVQTYMCDQHFLLHTFRKHGAVCMTVEKNVLLNGSYPGVKSDVPLVLPESACLIHFNWMVGHEKKACMKRHGMWWI